MDFSDIFFNFTNGTFKPYRKPNDSPVYIHVNSNHPPSIIKELPMSVTKRISNISPNEEIFDNAPTRLNPALFQQRENKCC